MDRRGVALVLAATAITAGGCGQSSDVGSKPVIGRKGSDSQAASALGFPAFATKNTTRVGGGDPTADAAAVAQALYHYTHVDVTFNRDRRAATVTVRAPQVAQPADIDGIVAAGDA